MTTTLKAQQAEPSHVPEVQIGAVSDLSMRGRRTNCRSCPPKMQKTQDRTATWPTDTTLQEKLYGDADDLRKTRKFIADTGMIV